jgi:cystathionine beta-synthase
MGAQLVYVGDGDGLATSAREDLAAELATGRADAFFTEQHNNAANAVGYYPVADELLRELDRVDVLVSPVGTGGSLFGTARRLRALGCRARVIGVEPVGSIAFGAESAGPYWQSGTGTPPGATVGAAVDYTLLDAGVKIGDVEAFATVRAIAARLGLLLGGSAGGAVYAALERLDSFPPASTVVTIVCDGGEKYLDTVFDDEWLCARELHCPRTEHRVAEWLARYSVPDHTDHIHDTDHAAAGQAPAADDLAEVG